MIAFGWSGDHMAHIAVWQLEYQVIYLFVGLSGREQDTVAWDL